MKRGWWLLNGQQQRDSSDGRGLGIRRNWSIMTQYEVKLLYRVRSMDEEVDYEDIANYDS